MFQQSIVPDRIRAGTVVRHARTNMEQAREPRQPHNLSRCQPSRRRLSFFICLETLYLLAHTSPLFHSNIRPRPHPATTLLVNTSANMLTTNDTPQHMVDATHGPIRCMCESTNFHVVRHRWTHYAQCHRRSI